MSDVVSSYPNCQVAVISYSKTVCVYELGLMAHPSQERVGVSTSAHVLPGTQFVGDQDRAFLRQNRDAFVSTVAYAQQSLADILRTFSSRSASSSGSHGHSSSALVIAIDSALALVPEDATGQILAFLSRAPSLGPGALALKAADEDCIPESSLAVFRTIGSKARNQSVVADMICLGHGFFSVPLLTELTNACGGEVLLHTSLSDACRKDVEILFGRTQREGFGCDPTMDFYVSAPVLLDQVVGPFVPDTTQPKKDSAGLAHQFRLIHMDPNQTSTFYLEIPKVIDSDEIVLQLECRFTDVATQREMVRVISTRIPVTADPRTFLSSISSETMTVLFARRLLLRARDLPDLQSEMYCHTAMPQARSHHSCVET